MNKYFINIWEMMYIDIQNKNVEVTIMERK